MTTLELALYGEGDNWPLGIDLYGDEAENPLQPFPARQRPSPLMADVPGADTTNWSSDPRPTVTAWRGAGIDAYYFDAERGVWLHCITGEIWNAD